MCEIATIVTTALSAATTIMQAGAQADARHAAAASSERSAAIADQEAQAAERRQRESFARSFARRRAHLAIGGVERAGSPLDVFDDLIEDNELDVATARRPADLRARSLRDQAARQRAEANGIEDRATFEVGKSIIGAGASQIAGQGRAGSLLGSAASGGGLHIATGR